jgi:hypothetical protein
LPETKDRGRDMRKLLGMVEMVCFLIIAVVSHVSKLNELHILKGCQLLHINYTSIKLIKNKLNMTRVLIFKKRIKIKYKEVD